MYETDFLSKGKDIDLRPSVEDKRALRAMEESVTKVSGHYLEKDPEMHQKNRDKMKEYSENEAAEVVRELKELLEGSGFHLTKFLSNSQGSLFSVSKEDCRVSQGKMDINSSRTKMVLGVA